MNNHNCENNIESNNCEPYCRICLKPNQDKEIEEKQKIESELSIFWNEIAENLPKSFERSALGDEKIFNAVKIAYIKFRPFILTQFGNKRVEQERQRITKEIKEKGLHLGYKNNILDIINI